MQRDAQIGLEDPEFVEFVMPTAPGGRLQAISRVAFHPKFRWWLQHAMTTPGRCGLCQKALISFNHIFPISAVAPVTCESASPTGQLVLSGEGHRCAQIHLFVEQFAGGVE